MFFSKTNVLLVQTKIHYEKKNIRYSFSFFSQQHVKGQLIENILVSQMPSWIILKERLAA